MNETKSKFTANKMDQDSHSVLKSYTMCQSNDVSVQKYLLMN